MKSDDAYDPFADGDEPDDEFDGDAPGDDEEDDDDEEEEDEEDDEDEEEAGDGPQRPAVFITTAQPVAIRIDRLADERAPEGSVLGAYIGDRLVARSAMRARGDRQAPRARAVPGAGAARAVRVRGGARAAVPAVRAGAERLDHGRVAGGRAVEGQRPELRGRASRRTSATTTTTARTSRRSCSATSSASPWTASIPTTSRRRRSTCCTRSSRAAR